MGIANASMKRTFIILLILIASLAIALALKNKAGAPTPTNNNVQVEPATHVNSDSFTALSGEQFHQIFLKTILPNTMPLLVPPSITGNEAADQRIVAIAHRRGFRLSYIPEASIVKTEEKGLEGDDLLQFRANSAWQELKNAAKSEGITLTLTSAYRPIEYQRELFLSRLSAAGASAKEIADGSADHLVAQVLEMAAPPGYSRHHSGYTIDLACDKVGLHNFKNTPCYRWISANSYQNVRRFGWIPSYPEGASEQGPEPEPWEFVWVGKI